MTRRDDDDDDGLSVCVVVVVNNTTTKVVFSTSFSFFFVVFVVFASAWRMEDADTRDDATASSSHNPLALAARHPKPPEPPLAAAVVPSLGASTSPAAGVAAAPAQKGGGPPGGRDTETVVGQTAPSAQIDRWLHQTLSKMPVQNWTVKQHHHRGASSYAAGDAAGDAAAVDVGDSFGRMVIAPERVEALNGPIMRVDRIDGETVDVNMNLHFRAHFGKGQLEDGATAKNDASAANDGEEGQKNGGRTTLALGEVAHKDADGNAPRLVELKGDDEEFHAATTRTTNVTPDDAYASPVDGRYAVARYDGNIEDGESRGFLYSEHNDDNNNSNSTRNNRASTSELKTDALAEEFRIDAKNVRLLERIAVGGFAEVFRGSYQGTLVAVKQLLERGKSVREKLENEVQTLARLRHPNLLLFMGYSLEPPLILTEFMRRGSLHGILKSEECFKVDGLRCLNIAMAVARGMHYLHSRSPPILHLDLKSPNILVDEKWRVKIADFGMSRVRFSTLASARSEFHGTPEWMAPEMLRAEPYDERADIYSFGVVCWELLTARTPWDDLHPMQVVAVVGYSERRLVLPPDWNKRREELVLASSQRHLPLTQADELAFDAIASLFDACSAKDVDARPKSFEHIARALDAQAKTWRRSLPPS